MIITEIDGKKHIKFYKDQFQSIVTDMALAQKFDPDRLFFAFEFVFQEMFKEHNLYVTFLRVTFSPAEPIDVDMRILDKEPPAINGREWAYTGIAALIKLYTIAVNRQGFGLSEVIIEHGRDISTRVYQQAEKNWASYNLLEPGVPDAIKEIIV